MTKEDISLGVFRDYNEQIDFAALMVATNNVSHNDTESEH